MAITEANDDSFSGIVKDGIIAIDFWAPWCGPCKLFGPVFEKVSEQMKGIKFVRVNTDEAQGTTQQFSIRSIPTVVVLIRGREAERFSGVFNEEQLKEKLKRFL